MTVSKNYTIGIDDLEDGQVIALLEQHRFEMLRHSPPESSHALDTDSLRHPQLTLWSARSQQNKVLGCIALKVFTDDQGLNDTGKRVAEIKSMKVDSTNIKKGIGQALLRHLLKYANERKLDSLFLETGTHSVFDPARGLYEAHGFKECGPFGNYQEDPYSVFYRLG